MIATVAHITDAHVLDASSPARVTLLDGLGSPFQSTFRPHETLTTQVPAGTVNAVRALGPDAVIQGGDLISRPGPSESSAPATAAPHSRPGCSTMSSRADLGLISRQLSYLDAQGGRPMGFIGGALDRNVTLYLP